MHAGGSNRTEETRGPLSRLQNSQDGTRPFRPIRGRIGVGYVGHFAQASDGVRIGQWDLSISGMRQIPIIVPSEAEQKVIARFIAYAARRIDNGIRLAPSMGV